MSYPLTVYKASAGSGKTFTLATEYIKLLIRNPQNYKQILAVTFTNKATEEMKMRILSQLYGIWHRLPDSAPYAVKVAELLGGEFSAYQIEQRAGEALRLLLHNYSYFRVETIDSFFQSVLRNLARELGLTANLRVALNDVQVEEMAVDQLIESLSTTDAVLQWLLRYIMDNISEDRSWNVIGQVKDFGRTIFRDYYKAHNRQLTALMQEEDFFDDFQSELRRLRQQATRHMAAIADEFFHALEAEGLCTDDLSYGRSGVAGLFIKLKDGIFDETIVTKRATDCLDNPEKWCTKKHHRSEAVRQLAASTLDPLLKKAIDDQPWQWNLFQSATLTLRHLSQLRLLGSIEQKVRQLNDEQNRFLLSDTQQLLHELIDGSDTPFIFEKIGTQLEHIMIDEFQDTSTVQWQNFKVLLGETMSHKGSENLIVGDVKQSIYRWRSGDWRLLSGIRGQFDHAVHSVRIETLGTNYRSARRVVAFNNAFFTLAAASEQVPAYDDVVQQVPSSRPDDGHVAVTLLPAEDYEAITLQALAGDVEALLEDGVQPAGIAVLVRSNEYIPLVADCLMRQIPGLKVVSDEAFRLDASPAVVTIVQAMRVLARPDDTIARACLTRDVTGIIGGTLPDAFNAQLLQLPLYELSERLYTLFSLDTDGRQGAYLCAFFDQVASFAVNSGSDVDAFLRAWDEEIGRKTIQSAETDGLRIISIHKSKGLEFPYVLVPFCHWRLELPDILWCTPRQPPFSQLPLVPVDYSKSGMKGTVYEPDYVEEHQQNIVDNLNLLYVAFTRAARYLHVYGRRGAAESSRSALIERVLTALPGVLTGSCLTGEDDNRQPLVFTYGASSFGEKPAEGPVTAAEAQSKNPFLRQSVAQRVLIESYPGQADFRQSSRSRQFASPAEADPEAARRQEYIQWGNVMHHVLSTIRTSDDIDSALFQLEQEGVIDGGDDTRHRLALMLRRRLAVPQAAVWFELGRWQVFNECTILSVDPATGRMAERRPDRVMTDGRATIVIDFKFGREHSDYHEQVRQYMLLLRQMGMPGVRGFLWFVYDNSIVEVKA